MSDKPDFDIAKLSYSAIAVMAVFYAVMLLAAWVKPDLPV